MPASYRLRDTERENATLALALLDAGFISAEDQRDEQSVDELIQAALNRHLKALDTPGQPLDLGVYLFRPGLDPYLGGGHDSGVYLMVEQGQEDVVDIRPHVKRWDAVDPRIAPSLLSHLRHSSHLVELFDPSACLDVIEHIYWHGDPTGGELLAYAADDLAHARGVDPATLSDEEVSAFANEHYMTPQRVHQHIPERFSHYQEKLELDKLQELAGRHGLAEVATLCECAREFKAQQERLPVADGDIFDHLSGDQAFSLILDHTEGPAPGFMLEMFAEYEQYAMQNEGFYPLHSCAIDPSDPESVARIPAMIQAIGEAIATTQRLVAVLGKEGP